jgi:Reverse transcriptase (RNA-dependent DNA polymerase)
MPGKWVHRYERKPGRWVFEPSPEARDEGAEVKALVEKHWRAPAFYYHLKRGGHVAALRQHQVSTHFFKVDIADFFGSISRSRLSRALKGYVSHQEALHLATASTVRHPANHNKTILPYGFIQSPLLASLALDKSGLGAFLAALHKDRGLVVTVYVDDIIVSGNNLPRLQEVLKELKARAEKSGFPLSDDKAQGPASFITAFNIHLTAGAELAIAAERLAELSDLIATSKSEFQKAGLLGNVQSVNAAQAKGLGK